MKRASCLILLLALAAVPSRAAQDSEGGTDDVVVAVINNASPSGPIEHSGRAIVVRALYASDGINHGDTDELPAEGGKRQAFTSIWEPGLFEVHAGVGITEGGGGNVRSRAIVGGLTITAGGNVITSDELKASADAACRDGATAEVSGSTEISNLVVNGQPISVGAEQKLIPLPNGGTLTVNERVEEERPGGKLIAVTAFHLRMPLLFPLLEVIVSHARAGLAGCPE